MRNNNRLVIVAAASVVAGFGSLASAQVTVDGTRDAAYGNALAVQTVNTQFGDNSSELDAFYANINNGKLNLFFAGNLESNYNKLVVFLDTKSGGQNVIQQSSPIQDNYTGIKFDAGFDADYSMILNRGDGDNSYYVDFSELPTGGGGFGGYAGKVMIPGPSSGLPQQGGGTVADPGNATPGLPTNIQLGYNDANVLGVSGGSGAADPVAAAAVTTGTELSFDLSTFGITGNFKVFAFVNGNGHDFASNQFLPGLPAGTENLGNNGAGGLSNVDMTQYAGDQFVTIPYTATVNQWNLATGGSWSAPASWSAGTVPNGPTAQAVLAGPAGSGTRTVTLNGDITVQRLTFNNATASYVIASPGTLTVNASPLLPAISVLAGSHTISAPVTLQNTTRVEVATGSSLTLSGTVTAANQDLFVSGGGAFTLPATPFKSISVNGASLKLTGTGNTTLRGLTIDAGSSVDLTSGAIIIDYDDGFPQLDAIKAEIADGRLKSSTRVGVKYAIGYLDSAAQPSLVAYNGTPLDATALVFRATFKGDANLSGNVNFDDLIVLAQNYNGTAKQWYQGDFTGDGVVNFDDLIPLAQNYNTTLPAGVVASLGAAFAADFALAQSLVPEPTTLGAMAAAGLLVARRRK